MSKKEENRIPNEAEQNIFDESIGELLRQLVSHLRQNRTQLRQEWARRITQAKLLTAMSQDEIFAEAPPIKANSSSVSKQPG